MGVPALQRPVLRARQNPAPVLREQAPVDRTVMPFRSFDFLAALQVPHSKPTFVGPAQDALATGREIAGEYRAFLCELRERFPRFRVADDKIAVPSRGGELRAVARKRAVRDGVAVKLLLKE